MSGRSGWRALAAAAAALVALTACGGPGNTDPRLGRVVIDEENCLTGDCYTIWKACSGPDLLIHNSTAKSENEERWVYESPECEERP